jgi:hypothetical protein
VRSSLAAKTKGQTNMSKIEKLAQTTALTVVNDNDLAALTNAARDLQPANDMVGLPLKYARGRWSIRESKDNEVDVDVNERFVVDALSYSEEWKRWQDKKPTHKLSGRRVDGFVAPPRHVLPEADREEWPTGPKGPTDPWQEAQSLVLKSVATGELYTWTTSGSWGSRQAIGEFLDAYVDEVKRHAGEMPVVLLESWDKPHPEYVRVPTPRLKIVGWRAFGEGASGPGDPAKAALTRKALAALQMLALPKPDAAPAKGKRGDMDDEIPF